jgi:aminotransferase
MRERTITVNGFSKAYAMTGWRIGYLSAPEKICKEILKIHQHISTCATSFAQKGALAALKGPQKCVKEMVREYQKRRDLLLEGISQNTKINLLKPEGTFYAFLDIRKLKLTSIEAAKFFLDKFFISLIPGIAYGKSGEGFLRLSFATSQKNIKEALKRINKNL